MTKFLDEAHIHIKSGSGGSGCISFRREKYIPRGGPNGGNGGKGGDIWFVADKNLTTLLDFHYKREFMAPSGKAGEGNLKTGACGCDLRIHVPIGTLVKDAQTGEILADLTQDQKAILTLRGGRGGKGNHFFKSSSHQTPRMSQPGEPGQEKDIYLELKLLADVGIIGLPNAGKSTLLSKISNSKPKIADYPFTTLTPHLGIVQKEDQYLIAADIPGLIEGAHLGKGLGFKFLKHIERTKLLVHIVDVSHENPWQSFETINKELEQYHPNLLLKTKKLVILNKIDLLSIQKLSSLVRKFKKNKINPLPISALHETGVPDFISQIFYELPKTSYPRI